MYVRNVAGYNFGFKYRGIVIHIPSDGQIYSIPDDSGGAEFKELRVIMAMNIRTQKVIYINKDGSIASDNLVGHKRRGRPSLQDEKPKSTHKPKSKKKTNTVTVNGVNGVDGVVIIDIDSELDATSEEPPKKKRGRPRKDAEPLTKVKKKRGRPRKTPTKK